MGVPARPPRLRGGVRPSFAISAHVVEFTSTTGFGRAVGIAALSAIGVGDVTGKFSIGYLSDRLPTDRAHVLALCGVVVGTATAALTVAPSGATVLGLAVVFGISRGGVGALVTPVLADLFGNDNLNTLYGIASLGLAVTGAVAPTSPAWRSTEPARSPSPSSGWASSASSPAARTPPPLGWCGESVLAGRRADSIGLPSASDLSRVTVPVVPTAWIRRLPLSGPDLCYTFTHCHVPAHSSSRTAEVNHVRQPILQRKSATTGKHGRHGADAASGRAEQ
ncbi:hypothetical protein VB779_14495 [Haloarculaceae archaeon H-GB11]|nr:hypothetical protein [Haloarculaceae archaeon H-GB11]